MFRQRTSHLNYRKDGCNSSHNTLLHGAERVFPTKPSTNNNLDNSKSNAGTSRPPTGQQQPSKLNTLSSVTDVKGILQVIEWKLTNSSGTNTTALVFCDTADSNSWVSDSLQIAKDQGCEAFTVRSCVRETINVGSDIIDVKSMKETYPHLVVLDPVRYSYGRYSLR